MAEEKENKATESKPEDTKPVAEKPAPAKSAESQAAPAKPAKPAESKSASKEKDADTTDKGAADVSLSLDDAIEIPKVVKAKGSKNVSAGIIHVLATFNNTIVTITDRKGNVLGWSSAGKCGFRGSKKSTAYVAQVIAQDAMRQAMAHGVKEVEARLKGPGTGREAAVRAVQAMGIDVSSITDVTPVPHNGCRLRKARRV
jgi:small subunit ribosomal protein S11